MDEIIRVKNVSYSKYEELLTRRDELRKKALLYENAYISEFGDLILDVFKLKIECIRKKKTIEFCQAAINHGKSVDEEQLQRYLEKELLDFNKQLDEMIKENEAAKAADTITEFELLQIKKIYRKIAKQIHPDINPLVEKNSDLMELWQRAVIAYNCNKLKDLREVEVLVFKALDKIGGKALDVEIPNINNKIIELEEEIKKIQTTDPYQYKYLLDDEEAINDKKASLNDEKKSYKEYSDELEKILEGLLKKGVSFIWHMN